MKNTHLKEPLGTDKADEFAYILEKIRQTPFAHDPFKFLYIPDFLSRAHFDQIISNPQIKRPRAPDSKALIHELEKSGYAIQGFPGCCSSAKEYLKCLRSNKWPVDKGLLGGFGMTFRLQTFQTPLLKGLVDFFHSAALKSVLEKKFGITEPSYMETGIQKYLHGYEISPHPDIRKKCLTFMLNINTSPESEAIDMHTRLFRFKPERRYIYEFWKYNTNIERCWVPWDWCEARFETKKNNSIIIFAPSNDTLHGVKLIYDHLPFQRTQLYGNLWYEQTPVRYKLNYQDIDLLDHHRHKRTMLSRFMNYLKRPHDRY